MQKYKIVKTLGEGNFGIVYKATNTQTGETMAIKKFKQKYTTWDQCIELRQVKSLRKMSHPNIIKLKEVLHIGEELYLVFEYLDYNIYELYSRNKENKKKMTEKEIRNIVFQVTEGLAYMHKNGFFHRDMKPENLLIYNNTVKICDFGLAREVRSSPPYTQYVSTRWYRAPELLLRSRNYNSPVDIFALGCIMAELYNQSPLFPGSSEIDQLNKIVKILGTPDQVTWPQGYKLASSRNYHFQKQKAQSLSDLIPDASLEAIDLMESMLQYASRKRPTAYQILKHPYFENCKTQAPNPATLKEVVLESLPEGRPLDTKKQDKKQEILKLTKEKFRLTRQQIYKKEQELDGQHDLDSILKDLEKKITQKSKLPMISTRDKFNKPDIVQLRESKTEMSKPQSFKPPIHELRKPEREKSKFNMEYPIQKVDRNEPQSRRNDRERFNSDRDSLLPPSILPIKKDLFSNKLNFNFQPQIPQQFSINLPPPLPSRQLSNWPRGVNNPAALQLGKNFLGEPLRSRDLRPNNVENLVKLSTKFDF